MSQWYGTPCFHFRRVLNDRALIIRQSVHIHVFNVFELL